MMNNNSFSLSWDEYSSLKPKQKSTYLNDTFGHIQFLNYTQQISKELLIELIEIANLIATTEENPEMRRYFCKLLRSYSCVLYFTQPSTRTFTSFSIASQALGMINEEIRDPDISSMYKGESEIDTLLTLANLSDLIVLRQANSNFMDILSYELLKRGMKTRLINGGSGSDQHPTQALLDIYTLLSNLNISNNGQKDFTVSFVGDLLRSRTARSLSYMLALFPNVKQVFIAPNELQMKEDILSYLNENSISFTISEDLDQYLFESDAVYMMRIQDEYGDTSENVRDKYQQYHLSLSKVQQMKPDACIIHPLPRRLEIPIEVDYDKRAKYWEAVHRGKLIRMALIMYMFGFDDLDKLQAMSYPV